MSCPAYLKIGIDYQANVADDKGVAPSLGVIALSLPV